jgi:hypothetical protein
VRNTKARKRIADLLDEAFLVEQKAQQAAHDEVMRGFVTEVVDAGLVQCDFCGELIDACACPGGPTLGKGCG